MKKNIFFDMVNSFLWSFICKNLGYTIKNWQFWIISIIGIIIFLFIYNWCDD